MTAMISGPRGERGIALLITLIAISVVSVVGMALALSSSIDRLAASNQHQAVELMNVAEAGLELATRDLAAIADWNGVLDGSHRSPRAEDSPDAVAYPWPGTAVDVPRLTFELTCGSATPCSDGARRTVTLERPWGANNAVWQPFLQARVVLPTPLRPHQAYVVVWVGDDGSERDADPRQNGGGPAAEGRYILRARAEAFGPGGVRRAIEADLARICTGVGTDEVCVPGVRVLGWRAVSSVP